MREGAELICPGISLSHVNGSKPIPASLSDQYAVHTLQCIWGGRHHGDCAANFDSIHNVHLHEGAMFVATPFLPM